MRLGSTGLTASSARPEPGDSRGPVAQALLFVRPCVHVEGVLHVCVTCLHVSSGCRGLEDGWGWVGVGGGGLIHSCISKGAGLGHINILINMRESITGEARA